MMLIWIPPLSLCCMTFVCFVRLYVCCRYWLWFWVSFACPYVWNNNVLQWQNVEKSKNKKNYLGPNWTRTRDIKNSKKFSRFRSWSDYKSEFITNTTLPLNLLTWGMLLHLVYTRFELHTIWAIHIFAALSNHVQSHISHFVRSQHIPPTLTLPPTNVLTTVQPACLFLNFPNSTIHQALPIPICYFSTHASRL